MKFCKDCRFIIQKSVFALCGHPSAQRPAEVDLVTGEAGEMNHFSCAMARSDAFPELCGKTGQFWEPATDHGPVGFVA
jgi:hypothetical protein